MQFFETSLSLITFIIMIALATNGKLNQNKVRIFGIGCAIFAFHFVFEVIRWQMRSGKGSLIGE